MSEVSTVGELRLALTGLNDDMPVEGLGAGPRVDAYLHAGALRLETFT